MVLVPIIFRLYMHTSQRTQTVFIMNTILLMLCRDRVSPCYCKQPLKTQMFIVWGDSRVRSVSLNTGWRTKCHANDCSRNTFLLLKKHLTSGTELILIGWKIVPNEEHVQCDHRFASQPLANELLHSSHLFDTCLQKARGTTSLCGPWAACS